MLILGCGNCDRGDDAAGLLVIRRLRQLGVPAREHAGDMLSLIDTWSRWDEVVVVDATVSGSRPGAINVWDGRTLPLSGIGFPCSTHAFGLGEAIEMARALGRLPAKLTVYGIEAASCDHGGTLSAAVAEAIELLARQLAAESVISTTAESATQSLHTPR